MSSGRVDDDANGDDFNGEAGTGGLAAPADDAVPGIPGEPNGLAASLLPKVRAGGDMDDGDELAPPDENAGRDGGAAGD